MMNYRVVYQLIEPDVYRHLRVACGLSPKSAEAAEIGIRNSLCCVLVLSENDVVGMGRLVGDGACHCQVVDICVLPDHQGQGLGKLIMGKIEEFIVDNLPASCYVNLIADGEAYRLYEQYGFSSVWPESRGMGKVIK
ncbi:GNAT family N-acetyltransferase [Sphingobacterium sp. UT-1RO-CII-1]|uniref:GNAT family N-acetyltransferase n=1 Tax=Sphingobacterium sp. UT-1RO-CII-1 TaxID=2995225 RepID=UPI00227A87F4|nr:GNAT family N-acetyltransferase [Sphingobacterium sp. UT-1RO-CII-1]MCY4779551.1 GNAT family N-acetyltransferase [Sphingobacterium sp. UT-1RO-CII-1]